MPARPDLDTVARAFTLNKRQCEAFATIASSFLLRLLQRYPHDAALRNRATETLLRFTTQDYVALLGQGGSGKSHLLCAVLAFEAAWGSHGAIITSATSGLAATLVDGSTYHQQLGIGINYAHENPDFVVKDDVKAAWRQVLVFVIDECSMLGAIDLDVIDKRLRALKDNDVPFGGVFVVFGADFCQLDPVKATSLTTPLGSPSLKDRNVKGIELWTKVCDTAAVFTLEVSQRQTDEELKVLLLAMREGPPALTHEHLDRLNSRLLEPTSFDLMPSSTRILVPDNADRESVIKLRFRTLCQAARSAAVGAAAPCGSPGNPLPGPRGLSLSHSWSKDLPLLLLADVWTRVPKGSTPISPAPPVVCTHVWHHTADKVLNDRCGALPLVFGSLYRVTDNIALQIGCAKNMLVKVVDATIKDPGRNVTWDAKLGVHVVSTTHVTQLFVELQTGSWNKRAICKDMALGTIPIQPTWVPCRIPVKSSTTPTKTLQGSVLCLLFPLTCAWALTCHRFQGQTVDHLCLHAHQSSPYRATIVNKRYYYVAVSRVRTLLGLSMTEPMELDPEYYSPDTSLLVHDARLAVRTLQTRLQYAEAWRLQAVEITELEQQLHAAIKQHDTQARRLTEELDRAAFLASVGTTPNKARARKAKELKSTPVTSSKKQQAISSSSEKTGTDKRVRVSVSSSSSSSSSSYSSTRAQKRVRVS